MSVEKGRRHQTVRQGKVVSTKMEKTAVVQVERRVQHPLYKKMLRRRKKYLSHDPGGVCHIGDWVEIVEARPLSRRKRWRVRQVLRKAVQG